MSKTLIGIFYIGGLLALLFFALFCDINAQPIADTIDNRLWAYNAGIGRVIKGIKPDETREYIKRYHRCLKKR